MFEQNLFNFSTERKEESSKKGKILVVFDGNSLVHRAYHALPKLTTKNGELVNAVYGFLLVFLKAIKDFHPEYIAATFDLKAPTFRHEKFKEYKAKRPKAPDDLYSQLPKIKEILKVFNVPIYEKEGFEADDIICTIATLAPKKQILPKIETVIVSGDSDTFQLINKNTKVYFLRRGVKDTILYDEEKVAEKYEGLSPRQLLDFKSLRGDPSDNIPGVTGIGEKTAIQLIKQFGSLENLYSSLNNWEKALGMSKSVGEKLKNYKEQAFFSKTLVELRCDAPIDFNLENCLWKDYDKRKISQIFADFEFNSLISRLP